MILFLLTCLFSLCMTDVAAYHLSSYNHIQNSLFFLFTWLQLLGRLACKLYENMKREAAALKIQTNLRRHLARTTYTRLKFSVLVLQTGLRAMAACKVFRRRNQTKASIIIQVIDYMFLYC